MRMQRLGSWTALLAGAALLGGGVVAVGAAADVFAWRTDDGGYAFTDDEKAIPARYRDRAEVKRTNGLKSYGRFTPQDDRAVAGYQAQPRRASAVRAHAYTRGAVKAPRRETRAQRIARLYLENKPLERSRPFLWRTPSHEDQGARLEDQGPPKTSARRPTSPTQAISSPPAP